MLSLGIFKMVIIKRNCVFNRINTLRKYYKNATQNLINEYSLFIVLNNGLSPKYLF